jgi:hypothetical protein
VSRWLFAFALTQLFELPVYAWAMKDRGWPQRLVIGFAASAITHPLLWFVWTPLVDLPYWPRTLLGELCVVAIEAAWLEANKQPDALLWALLANAVSAGLGFLITGTVGWPW